VEVGVASARSPAAGHRDAPPTVGTAAQGPSWSEGSHENLGGATVALLDCQHCSIVERSRELAGHVRTVPAAVAATRAPIGEILLGQHEQASCRVRIPRISPSDRGVVGLDDRRDMAIWYGVQAFPFTERINE